MKFHLFGDTAQPKVVLIHGAMTPWQILEPHARLLMENFCVIIPAVDGHDEDASNEFISHSQQAQKIEDYLTENFGGEVFAVCGLSMGGAIAAKIWENDRIRVSRFVLDGAPLTDSGALPAAVMRSNYITILRNSKKRDKKTLENFKKNFLPEKYLEPFLRIADCMSEQSIANVVSSVCRNRLPEAKDDGGRVLYIHGTKMGEMLSKKSAKGLAKKYPKITIHAMPGAGHCEMAIYHPEKWVALVREFFAQE